VNRGPAALLISAALAAPLGAQTVRDDLESAKRRFAAADYQGSLTILDAIERNLRELGADDAREKLAPALAFYRAADYAMLGAREDAIAGFEAFLVRTPGAAIEPGAFPGPVGSAFAQAQKRSGARAPRESGIETAYEAFAGGSIAGETDARGDFSKGPLGDWMTAEEKADWGAASSDRDRAAVIEAFWRRRNPSPDPAKNPLRGEIDRRIAFSDARFRDGETRGSRTDRGEVFLLLGPPFSIGVKPLSSADDPSVLQQANDIAPLPPGATPAMIAEHNRAVDTNSTFHYAAEKNLRERWHYRSLPEGIPERSADFDFVTRQGAGRAQLSRTAEALRVLGAAKRLLRPAGTE
jgi:GWxTD domain-containing protein